MVAGPDGLDEVGEVVAAAAAARAFLEAGAEVGLPVGVAGDGEDALGAVEDVADLDLQLVVGGQAANLELELAVVKLEADVQGVGRLAVVA